MTAALGNYVTVDSNGGWASLYREGGDCMSHETLFGEAEAAYSLPIFQADVMAD
ncbi:hypothetical protein MLAC_34600 [Mycobacterium lacus]|uniref:Uncharacterized protein n=1 Tax=Mycobacterium lacus TaxID=169765 RepID=A0A7I7NND8_9MYCO|nr:hypothetical protein MLAC_34600 [Mycobacterium lacus]